MDDISELDLDNLDLDALQELARRRQSNSTSTAPRGDVNIDDMGLEILLGIDAMPVEISILLCVFFLLFVIGFTGNLIVIVRIVKTNRLFRQVYGKDSDRSRRMTTQRYVLLLAIVDLIVTMHIPFLFPYFYSGQWLVGRFMCKAFWVVENINKILSIHILTAMVIERYFIVLNSVRTGRGHIPRIATSLWFVGTFISIGLLWALLSFVDLDVMNIGDQQIKTCVTQMPDHIFVTFLVSAFILTFLVPAVVVSVCYTGLVRILKTRYALAAQKECKKTQLIQKVSKSILCVTAFHFACWTPFWVITLVPLFDFGPKTITNNGFKITQTLPLILPYVNCSFNWCFYVLLNKRLRKQIFRSSSSYATEVIKHHHHHSTPLIGQQC